MKLNIAMGTWKKKLFDSKHKASRTTSNRAKLYVPEPPPEGWPAFTNNYSHYGVRRAAR